MKALMGRGQIQKHYRHKRNHEKNLQRLYVGKKQIIGETRGKKRKKDAREEIKGY